MISLSFKIPFKIISQSIWTNWNISFLHRHCFCLLISILTVTETTWKMAKRSILYVYVHISKWLSDESTRATNLYWIQMRQCIVWFINKMFEPILATIWSSSLTHFNEYHQNKIFFKKTFVLRNYGKTILDLEWFQPWKLYQMHRIPLAHSTNVALQKLTFQWTRNIFFYSASYHIERYI